jgi:hypothetical protein
LIINLNKIFYNNFLLSLGLVTLSLGIFRIAEYSFSIANFIVLYLFFFYLKSNNKYVFAIYFFILTYLLLIAFLFFTNLNFIEYLKSFLLTSVMLFVYISSLFKPIYYDRINPQRIIIYIGIFIVLFELIQILEYLILGSSNTWFILDNVSISTATDIGRFQAVNFLSFMRPISFYHEPSYLGIILLILLICANELKVNKLFLFIFYIGIIISFSTTALVFLILYIILLNFKSIKTFLMLFIVVILLFYFLLDNETLDNIFRFNEIFNAGTSGNERLIGPYDYLSDQFFNKHNYFGIPLGQSELVFNNSFYLLFLYFGIFTPLLLLILIIFILKKFKKNAFKYLLAFFSLMFLSGALFTLESALILYLLNYTFNLKNSNLYTLSN